MTLLAVTEADSQSKLPAQVRGQPILVTIALTADGAGFYSAEIVTAHVMAVDLAGNAGPADNEGMEGIASDGSGTLYFALEGKSVRSKPPAILSRQAGSSDLKAFVSEGLSGQLSGLAYVSADALGHPGFLLALERNPLPATRPSTARPPRLLWIDIQKREVVHERPLDLRSPSGARLDAPSPEAICVHEEGMAYVICDPYRTDGNHYLKNEWGSEQERRLAAGGTPLLWSVPVSRPRVEEHWYLRDLLRRTTLDDQDALMAATLIGAELKERHGDPRLTSEVSVQDGQVHVTLWPAAPGREMQSWPESPEAHRAALGASTALAVQAEEWLHAWLDGLGLQETRRQITVVDWRQGGGLETGYVERDETRTLEWAWAQIVRALRQKGQVALTAKPRATSGYTSIRQIGELRRGLLMAERLFVTLSFDVTPNADGTPRRFFRVDIETRVYVKRPGDERARLHAVDPDSEMLHYDSEKRTKLFEIVETALRARK